MGYKKHKHVYIAKAPECVFIFSFIIVVIKQWRLRRKTHNFFIPSYSFKHTPERPSFKINRRNPAPIHLPPYIKVDFFWVNLYLSTHQTRHLYKIVAAFCCVLLLLLFYMYNTRKVFMFSDICIKEHKIFIYFTIMVVRSRRVYTHRDGWCTLEKRSYSTHFLDSFLSQVFILIASLCQEHNRTDISKTNQEKKWKKWKY